MSTPLNLNDRNAFGLLRGLLMVYSAFGVFSGARAVVHGKHVMSLSNTGLGSDLHLIDRISDPFDNEPSLSMMEAIPSTDDESLSQEPVPPEFRSRQSFGEFVLSSLLEQDPSPVKPSLLEIQVDRRRTVQMQNTAEAREIEYLNKLVDTVSKPLLIQVSDVPVMIQMNTQLGALADSLDFSGPSSVDINGPCSEGFVPFLERRASSLDECWGKCRAYSACTQAHFSAQANSCYLSHGISTRRETDFHESSDESTPSSVCRSLTAAGVKALNGVGLPPFRILPNNKVFLIAHAPIRRMLASTLAECQSACLESAQCFYGAWLDLDAGNGKSQNECVIGFNISDKCGDGPAASNCMPVCGSEDCILFNRNDNNLVSAKGLIAVPLNTMGSSNAGVEVSRTRSCESICRAPLSSEDVCLTICLAHERFKCQSNCHGQNCSAVAFTYGGNATEQTCTAFRSSVPFANGNATTDEVLVDVFVPALAAKNQKIEATGSLLQSSSRAKLVATLSRFLSPTDVRPKYTHYDGTCDVFHEGTMAGVGVGLSKFSAQSMDECWKLCEGGFSNNQCSQVQFHISSNECVIGDAIAKNFKANPAIKCRSLDYMPITTSNGLSGMILVSSVGDMGSRSDVWFSGATEAQLVNSIEECQALCKQADSGATDSVCRFGGYVDCASFHSSLCRSQNGRISDCGVCDRNPGGGVCRLPRLPIQGSETAAANQGKVDDRIPCLGGKCRWFEKGALGYSVQVATPARPAVDYIGKVNAVICDSVSYLPSPVQEPNSKQCFYPAESLWHCEQLCSSANKFSGNGKVACIGGLYQEITGKRQCKLARSRTVEGKACAKGTNCAWFELSGEGHTAGLEQTGLELADEARRLGALPFLIGKGQCQQFRALEAAFTNTPTGFQYSPVEDCIRACTFFPQCTSFQLTGSVSGGGGSCDVVRGNSSDCTFITCALSSALSLPIPTENNSTMCYSKTPLGTVEDGPLAIDMDGVDPGIPGFIVTNARVRRFGWTQVINKDQLALTASLEECQSMCRVSDGCVLGTWQPCQAVERECLAADRPGASRELQSTCNACRNVNLNPTQKSVQFPVHMGVCKMASEPQLRTQGCEPEPCYAFEEGSENYYILSMTKSPFLLPDGKVDEALLEFNGDTRTYVKVKSLAQCEDYCTTDPTCKYGHFAPKSAGYSECYLTANEVRITDGQKYQLKQPVKCDGTCIVFMKLPTKLPLQLTSR